MSELAKENEVLQNLNQEKLVGYYRTYSHECGSVGIYLNFLLLQRLLQEINELQNTLRAAENEVRVTERQAQDNRARAEEAKWEGNSL